MPLQDNLPDIGNEIVSYRSITLGLVVLVCIQNIQRRMCIKPVFRPPSEAKK